MWKGRTPIADIAKSGTPSLATLTPPPSNYRAGLLAGEAIAAGDAVYIKASDNKLYKATGAAVNEAARVVGFAFTAADSGEPLTYGWDLLFRYGATLSPGTPVYLSGAVAGAIADAASTGGTRRIGYVFNDTCIHLDRDRG